MLKDKQAQNKILKVASGVMVSHHAGFDVGQPDYVWMEAF